MRKLELNRKVKIRSFNPNDKNHFFGYYGKSPWDKSGRYFVCLESDFFNRFQNKNDIANILLVDLEKNKTEKIAETKAWNWQQGCMLQWLGSDFNSKIIFNDRAGDKFVSRIIDIKTKKEKIIPHTVYDVHPSGKYAISLSFSRLNMVRKGYGYEGVENKNKKKIIPENEGVYLVDFETGRKKLIISLGELAMYKPLDSMKKGNHWIDQPIFNPKGDRFCFLHRWEIGNGLFHTRFFTADINGKNLFMFPDSGFYSHFTWKNNKDILVWCSVSEKFGKIRKGNKKSNFILEKILPIYRKLIPRYIRKKILPANYYLITDQSSDIKKIKINYEDGHPSFTKDERYLITDTYPDAKHFRKLILYDFLKNKKINLGKFYTLPKGIKDSNWDNGGLRCDLHPRWNFQGNKICFDSVHEGKRGVYVIDLKKIIS